MKKLLLAVFISTTFIFSASAQKDSYTQPLSLLKGDYNQVGIVAHVKIKEIKLAAQDVHPLYIVRSEVIEPFKGGVKRGQPLEFYFHAEDDYDVQKLIGEWVIFLEGRHPIPSGGKGWYELENSKRPPSEKILAKMRRIRNGRKRS
jgi:hypothetical protein